MSSGEDRTILVTGAGGFIGGRIVEVLHAMGGWRVRAGVRRWASAARIGRFPLEIVHCDVTDPIGIARVLEGASAVVHCAVGDPRVTIEGTRNLLAAAARAGLERVVHLSSVAVYGDAPGDFDESRPLERRGDPYGDAKIEAEELCREFAERGVPVAILRPSLVYGPFSASWTVEWAQRLRARPWLLSEEDCQGTCNLLYVDDLVGAVLRALERPEAVGEAFNVNGAERPTWSEYFRALNDAMELPELVSARPAASHLTAHLMQPVRTLAKFLLAHRQAQIMGLYQRYDWARVVMRRAEALIRKAPTTREIALLRREVSYPTARAEARLGWRPVFSLRDGVELSAAWLRHHGFAPAASRPAG